ncbi:hypothetical protein HS088_TW11G00737 [Tripterygium wilfordii]|uniref:C2H2-type domain-containing protein n=1 Tax=Tripterygium wilfordii TaxID=458696 RepID=A0A7J7D2T3_TRIWF|nr:uncharacterized protein LOC120009602 [Tripterygium wilfordii]KAF5740660.1 hypothetical protein HS088_TW11G00737 [Tripterygium wilfordii]
MGTLCVAVDAIPGKPIFPLSLKSPIQLYRTNLHFSLSLDLSTRLALTLQPVKQNLTARRWRVRGSAADYDIDMVKNREGVYTPKKKKVVVLWDLDNKPPRGPPYQAAMALKKVAEKFGEVVDMSAYANRHAFIHLPMWVVEERRERKQFEILERKGLFTPAEAYVCKVCGRKCKTSLDLKKHFKQLHERERQKKLNRMRSLKGKKRQRYKERFISGNEKYNEAARELVTPKMGYGLAAELRRAGVYVKTVEDKPQAADWAVKRQMQHSMTRGIDWLILVSDDSDFSDMLRKAREEKLGTVVVGDWDRALGRHADLWVPWAGVESGEVTEKDLVPKSRESRQEDFERDDESFSVTYFDDGRDLNNLVNELVAGRSEFNGTRISAFSEGEKEEEEDDDDQDYVFWDSEDEEDGGFLLL